MRLFHKPGDYAAFEQVLAEGLERYPVELLTYGVRGTAYITIRTPSIILYAAPRTPATQNPTGGEFALHYDPSQVLIYTDQNCTNEVQPDAPVISDSPTVTLYAKAVTTSQGRGDIEIDLEYNGNILDTVHETAMPVLGMTAYRTGGNYGTAVSEADRASGDPSNYVILVDDGYDQDPAGVQDLSLIHI